MKFRIEKKKESLKIHFKDQSHTFVNLLRGALWQAGAESAAYNQQHHLKSDLTLMVQGKNPEKLLKKAAELIESDASALQRHATSKL